MTLFLAFIALFPRLLLGFCIVHSVWKSTDGRSLPVKIFLAAGIGFGVSSLLGFVWIWIGLPISVYAVLESVASVAWAGWTLYKDRNIFHFTLPKDKSNIVWASLLAFGVLLFASNLFFYALQYPHGRPDAWINWNVVARFIRLGGADWQLTFLRQWDHPDYPLYMAVTNAITWSLIREPSTWGPIAFHSIVSIFTAGLLFSFVNYLRGFKQAALSAVLFMSLPFVVDQGMRQYADLLLAHLILAAGGLTLLYFQTGETRLAILAGLLTGLGGWAKNEGLPAILGFSIVWLVIAVKEGNGQAFKKYLFGLVFPLLVVASFKLFLAPPNDLLSAQGGSFDKILDPGRYAIIFKQAGLVLWNLSGAPVPLIGLIILMAVIFGGSAARIHGAWSAAAVITLQLAVYFFIYLLTPLELTYHLNTSLDRLYMHILPLGFLWLFVWMKSPPELLPKER